jgi:hypothetical protein
MPALIHKTVRVPRRVLVGVESRRSKTLALLQRHLWASRSVGTTGHEASLARTVAQAFKRRFRSATAHSTLDGEALLVHRVPARDGFVEISQDPDASIRIGNSLQIAYPY